MRHSENRQSDYPHSPKRFLKGLASLPLRQHLKSPSQLGSNGSRYPSSHARSLSHEAFQSKNVQTSSEWTNLIPPLPATSRNNSSDSFALQELAVPPQRHSIAISPISSKNLPDMLQPLPNPEAERDFDFPKMPAPNSRTSSLGLVKENRNPFRKHDKPESKLKRNSDMNNEPRVDPRQELPTETTPTHPFSSLLPPLQDHEPSPVVNRTIRHPQTHPQMQKPRQYGHLLPFFNKSKQRPMSEEFDFTPHHTPPPQQSLPETFSNGHPNNSTPMPRQIQQQDLQKSLNGVLHAQSKPPSFQPPITPLAPRRQLTPNSLHLSSSPTQNPALAPDVGSLSLSRKQLLQLQLQQTPHETRLSAPRKRKICKVCDQPIAGQFVRALGSAYHVECFTCHECGHQCSSKFFPQDITLPDGSVSQVPLCEYDYFKKLDLICHNCNCALRGPYITALGNKYHVEHFKCSECGKVFDSEESYYEHESNIYCHYHYSKLFATKCEGCQSSIVKQFVELFKGGKNQQWHPECYMVYKFWNVFITPDSVGLQSKFELEKQIASTFLESDIDPEKLLAIEQQIESIVMRCWLVLSGFEETLASCISAMLLSACTGNRANGIQATSKLIVYVEILFSALDFVQNMCIECNSDPSKSQEKRNASGEEIYSVDAFDNFQPLRKEPRNISGKLMSYLAILRKSTQIANSGSLSAELLSVITGCAHYLKLLFRTGLNNALKLNKLRGDTRALDGFLKSAKRYEEVEEGLKNPASGLPSLESRLAVPQNATDACRACKKSIEKSCYRFKNIRWHRKCFECSSCKRKPSLDFKVENFLCGADDSLLCVECSKLNAKAGMGYQFGFTSVSDLSQLIYLLKIAMFRTKAAIRKDDDPLKKVEQGGMRPQMSNIAEEGSQVSDTETVFSKTLQDVTSLRTKRESQKLSNSVKKSARKSVILEAPEADSAREDNADREIQGQTRKPSSASSLSFVMHQGDGDQANFLAHNKSLKIRDEPPIAVATGSLGRTSDLLKNEKSLTLDDIPRIVAAEQARDQRPNAFKHHNSLYEKAQPLQSSAGGSIHQFKGLQDVNVVKKLPVPVKIKYYSELSKSEHFILRHIAVEAFLAIRDDHSREDLVSLIQTRKLPTFWDKFKFGGGEKSKAMNVFGTDLQELTKRYGVDSDLGVGPAQLRIPIVVDDVVNSLRKKDMSVEGIFRLNGNIKNLRELTEQINKNPLKSPDFHNYSAVQLAALLKKWLRELPNPLLTFNLFELWISSRKTNDSILCKRILQLTYCMLPRSHRNLLEVLLHFFRWVASFASTDDDSGSKMDTHNLATVLAPNILISKSQSAEGPPVQSGESYFLAIEVVNQMIEMHEELAVIPPDLWELFERCQFTNTPKLDTLSSKDIFSKVQKHSKEDPELFKRFLKLEASTKPSQQNTIKRGQMKVDSISTAK